VTQLTHATQEQCAVAHWTYYIVSALAGDGLPGEKEKEQCAANATDAADVSDATAKA